MPGKDRHCGSTPRPQAQPGQPGQPGSGDARSLSDSPHYDGDSAICWPAVKGPKTNTTLILRYRFVCLSVRPSVRPPARPALRERTHAAAGRLLRLLRRHSPARCGSIGRGDARQGTTWAGSWIMQGRINLPLTCSRAAGCRDRGAAASRGGRPRGAGGGGPAGRGVALASPPLRSARKNLHTLKAIGAL